MATAAAKLDPSCTSSVIIQPPAPPPNPPPERLNASTFSGVWCQHCHYEDLASEGFVLGTDIAVSWSDFEIDDGVYNWTSVDAGFAGAAIDKAINRWREAMQTLQSVVSLVSPVQSFQGMPFFTKLCDLVQTQRQNSSVLLSLKKICSTHYATSCTLRCDRGR